jgi:hypothetical protein
MDNLLIVGSLIISGYLSIKIVKFFNLEGINMYSGLSFDDYLTDSNNDSNVNYDDDECDIIRAFLAKKNV